jgi:plasmid stabilization system protein ParE
MRIVFLAEAKAEFDEAERYYERQMPGLGARFRAGVRGAPRRVRNWPRGAPVERGPVRHLVLGRFPYKRLYAVEADQLVIIAVAHQHRAPAYWIERNSR